MKNTTLVLLFLVLMVSLLINSGRTEIEKKDKDAKKKRNLMAKVLLFNIEIIRNSSFMTIENDYKNLTRWCKTGRYGEERREEEKNGVLVLLSSDFLLYPFPVRFSSFTKDCSRK